MNELVERLSSKKYSVQANRPDKNAAELKKRIDMNFVHIFFKETGTELGIFLDQEKCDYSNVNWEEGTGKVHFEGAITLNYEKVRCVADINVKTMNGKGKLDLFGDEEEYAKIISASKAY